MAREDWFPGLSVWSEGFVSKPSVKKEKSGETFDGLVGSDYPLHKYTLPNGKVYFEKVQASPWASGPHFFLALKNSKGNWIPRSLWSRETIDNT